MAWFSGICQRIQIESMGRICWNGRFGNGYRGNIPNTPVRTIDIPDEAPRSA